MMKTQIREREHQIIRDEVYQHRHHKQSVYFHNDTIKAPVVSEYNTELMEGIQYTNKYTVKSNVKMQYAVKSKCYNTITQ